MRRLTTCAMAALVLSLAVPVFAGVYSTPASAAPATAAASVVVPSFESRLLSLTNADRARAGLAALRSSAALVSIARSWSAHMAATGQLAHNPSLASQVRGWSMLGENAAMAWSSDQAEQLFMASPGHRANILQPQYNWVGIGVVKAPNGDYWFTVDFEQAAGYAPPVHRSSSNPVVHRTPVRQAAWVRSAAAGRASRSATRTAVPKARTATVAPPGPSSPAAVATAARLTSVDARAEAAVSAALPRAAGPDPSGRILGALLAWVALGVAGLGSVALALRRAAGG
jgi:Cysteine-rich secretory protein family